MAGFLQRTVVLTGLIVGVFHLGHPPVTCRAAGLEPDIRRSGSTWTVYSNADAGMGTLREALAGAGPGDLVTFDNGVFPVSSPASIQLLSALPALTGGSLTVDAAGAGVILDGSSLAGDAVGLEVASDSNVVRGLQILYFPGGGAQVSSEASENSIEGNVISSNGGSCGLEILGARNVVTGNFIGTDVGGTTEMGNSNHGVCIVDSSGNSIGPGNVIAHNGGAGVQVSGSGASANTITQNSITANALAGIVLEDGGNGGIVAPVITTCTETSVSGTAQPDCIIEVFSDSDAEGETYEGATASDGSGVFTFTEPAGLTGPDITATATDSTGNTSAFSLPASVAIEPTTWSGIKAEFGGRCMP